MQSLETQKTRSHLLINLAYVTHHKHAHSSATNREIEREGGGKNDAPKSTFLKNKYINNRGNHQGTETGLSAHRREKEEHCRRVNISVWRTERQTQREEKHQTVTFKSHQRSFLFHGIWSGSFIHGNGSTGGELKGFRLGRQLNIDHACLWGGGGGLEAI